VDTGFLWPREYLSVLEVTVYTRHGGEAYLLFLREETRYSHEISLSIQKTSTRVLRFVQKQSRGRDRIFFRTLNRGYDQPGK